MSTEVAVRAYDLPPLWDGVPVAWGEWRRYDTTLVLHADVEELACDQCGALGESDLAFGKRGHLVNLVVHRCRHCGHDVVEDRLADEWWDLDPSDYGDIGSIDPTIPATLDAPEPAEGCLF